MNTGLTSHSSHMYEEEHRFTHQLPIPHIHFTTCRQGDRPHDKDIPHLPQYANLYTICTHTHTTFTARSLSSLIPNSIVNTPPRKRGAFQGLSIFVRSEVLHTALETYTHKIGRTFTDIYDFCHKEPGNPNILYCTAQHREELQALEHLWSQSVVVLKFVGTCE